MKSSGQMADKVNIEKKVMLIVALETLTYKCGGFRRLFVAAENSPARSDSMYIQFHLSQNHHVSSIIGRLTG